MTELFLIAHKVRGEPAFDVATQMECPICHNDSTERTECVECDGEGHWWIIPTSGHRAYPWWHVELDLLGEEYNHAIRPGEMPESLPDHYPHSASPSRPAIDIRSLVPPVKIQRRF